MAGKQMIVLPSLVNPLLFACSQLLLNKNPSANGQYLKSNLYNTLKLKGTKRPHLPSSFVCSPRRRPPSSNAEGLSLHSH